MQHYMIALRQVLSHAIFEFGELSHDIEQVTGFALESLLGAAILATLACYWIRRS